MVGPRLASHGPGVPAPPSLRLSTDSPGLPLPVGRLRLALRPGWSVSLRLRSAGPRPNYFDDSDVAVELQPASARTHRRNAYYPSEYSGH